MKRVRLIITVVVGISYVAGLQTSASATATSQNNAVAGLGLTSASSPASSGSADQLPFTGSFLYAYPIDVPPGIAGLQPELTLNYNSSSGNGWVGVGWDLSIGSIQRSTKNGIPTYTSADTFVFVSGGSTRELVSADNGPVNYRNRIEETFQRFAFNGTSWTLTDKNGTTMYFGETAAGRTGPDTSRSFAWALERVVDRNGNSMKVVYLTDQRQLYPATILYTYPSGSTSVHRRVRFILQDRLDGFSTYRGGFAQVSGKRLAEIDTEICQSGSEAGPWNTVKRYVLGYAMRTNGVRSELVSVTVVGVNGSSTLQLPPTRFTYASTATNWTAQPGNSPFQLPDYSIVNGRDNGLRFLDLNGDGRLDVLRAVSVNGSLVCDAWLNTPNGWVSAPQWKISDAFIASDANGAWWDVGIRVADLNGDGYADLIKATNYNGGVYYDTWINNKNGWIHDASQWRVPDPNWAFSVIQSGNWFRDNGVALIDINGDGLPDLVQGLDRDGGTAYDLRRVRLNTGTGWANSDAAAGWNIPADMTLVTADGTESVGNGLEFVDLNGDGLPDLVQRIENDDVGTTAAAAWINKGGNWESAPQWIPPDYLIKRYSNKALDYGIRFCDLNGDGLPDLIQSVEGLNEPGLPVVNPVHRVFMNTGNGWRDDSLNWTIPDFFSIVNRADWTTRNWGSGVADINGDGRPDFYRAYYDDAGSTGKSLYWGNSNPELLTQVTNSFGGTTDVTYTNTTALYGHNVPFSVNVVNGVNRSDGRGTSIPTTYSYTGGLFDPIEKEFLGFAQVDAVDAAGVKTSMFFDQITSDANGRMAGNPLKGRLYKQQIFANGAELKRDETEWEAPTIGKARFARAKSSTQTILDGPIAQAVTSRYVYDDLASPAIGNVVQIINDGDPAISGDERTQQFDFAVSTNGFLGNFPMHVLITGAAGQTLSETQFIYDALPYGQVNRGNVTSVRRWLDSPAPGKWVQTSTSYNAAGLPTRTTDARGNSTATTYDAFGFPSSVTDRANHVTLMTADLRSGQPLLTTDANNQVTTYTYDPLGRVTTEVRPLDSTTFPSMTYNYHDDQLGNPLTQFIETQSRLSTGMPDVLWTKQYLDGLGRSYRTDQEGVSGPIITQTQFDARGLEAQTSLPRIGGQALGDLWVTTAFDALRRPVRVTQPDTTFTTTSYSGRVTSVQDALGRIHTTQTDAYGRTIRRTEPSIVMATQYSYDDAGNLISLTNAEGRITSFTYDSLGRKLTMVDPNAGSWNYSYDDNGNLTSQTDARGVKISLTYDTMDRLTRRTLAADPSSVTGKAVGSTLASLVYDETAGRPASIGRLTSASDSAGAIAYYHDALGRVTRQVRTVDGISYQIQTTFDANDRPTTVRYPSDAAITYTYNAAGLPNDIRDSSNTVLAAFSNYDALERPMQSDFAAGKLRTTQTFDAIKQLLSRSRTDSYASGTAIPIRDITYQYDKVRNITSLTDAVSSTRTQTFSYDTLDRLAKAQGLYGTDNYTYDDVGNLLSKAGSGYTYADTFHPDAVTGVTPPGLPVTDSNTILAWGLEQAERIYAIRGSVKNADGSIPTQAVVSLSGPTETTVSVSTISGSFEFRGLPVNGSWKVYASATGLRSGTTSFASLNQSVNGVQLTLANSTSPVPAALGTNGIGASFGSGRYGSCLAFNGSSDVMAFPQTENINPAAFSVMLWVKPTTYPAFGGYTTLIAKSTATALQQITNGFRLLMYSDGRPIFEMTNRTSGVMSYWCPPSMPLNQWSFISCSYDGSRFVFYFNGIRQGSRAFTGSLVSNDLPITLGASLDGGRRPVAGTLFQGSLDEPRIQGRAYSDSEMLAAYNAFSGIATYTYDATGNCLTKSFSGGDRWSYRYDPDGRLDQVKKNGAITATFVYDGFGSRVKKVGAGGTTVYVDGLFEVRPDGTRVDHVVGNGTAICDIVRTSSTSTSYFFVNDHLTTAMLVVSSAGAVVQDSAYKPFGERLAINGSSPNHRWYTGQEEDSETGLDFYNARYYDPSLGRFVSPDSMVPSVLDPQSLNRYAYVRNNPVNYADPSGHFFAELAVLTGAAVGAYTGYRIAESKGYNWGSWQTYAYTQAGGAIGGASTAVGVEIAASGMIMANTAAIMATSSIYSSGMNALSGSGIDPTIGYGFGSYNTATGTNDSLLDGDNKWYTDVAYAAGALANLQDATAGFDGTSVNVNAASVKNEWWSHSSITSADGHIEVSAGPVSAIQKSAGPFSPVPGKIYDSEADAAGTWKVPLNNVNRSALRTMTENLAARTTLSGTSSLQWNVGRLSCVSQASRALSRVGVPTLPFNFHPYILNAQLTLRQIAIQSAPLLMGDQ